MTATINTPLDLVLKCIRRDHGLIIKVDGSIEAYDPTLKNNVYDFKKLKDDIGCQFGEIVKLSDEVIMVLDEEGKLTNKEINLFATALYQERFKIIDSIIGDVVVCHTRGIK